MRERPRRRGLGNAMLIATSALLTAVASWIALRGGETRRMAVGGIVFFAACLASGVWIAWRDAIIQRNLAALSVEIVGSVPIRIRPGRFVLLVSAVAMVLFTVAWGFQGSVASVVPFAGALLVIGLVPVVVWGPPARRAIVFEPGGLRLIEPRFSVVAAWDDIISARLVGVHDNLIVAIDVRDAGQLVPEAAADAPPSVGAARRLARLLTTNRKRLGCDLCVAPFTFGVDGALLLRAIETYVREVEARRSLAPRPSLGPAATGRR